MPMLFAFLSDFCGVENMYLTHTNSYNVTSPNFPKPYPRTIDCYWTVTTLAKGTIILNFLIFGVDLDREEFVVALSNITLPHDYDSIEEGPRVEWFTGSLAPRAMFVPHSEIQLVWNANIWNTEEQEGFVVKISLAHGNSEYILTLAKNNVPFL